MMPIWKNLGYAVYLALYFSVTDSLHKWPETNLTSAAFKILPIAHILLMIISTATNSSGDVELVEAESQYRRKIFAGLVFSIFGDIALVYKDTYECFLLGITMFAIAQSCYIVSFGLRPFGGGPTFVSFAIIAFGFYAFVTEDLTDPFLQCAIPVYATLIFTMLWRSFVRLQHKRTVPALFACAGAMCFVASDFMLALDLFRGSFYRAPLWVMLTYYLAQLLIGLSACDEGDSTPPTFGMPPMKGFEAQQADTAVGTQQADTAVGKKTR